MTFGGGCVFIFLRERNELVFSQIIAACSNTSPGQNTNGEMEKKMYNFLIQHLASSTCGTTALHIAFENPLPPPNEG